MILCDTNTFALPQSSGLMPGFDSLQQQKRGNDASAQRRESLSDQARQGGMFHTMFHKYVILRLLPFVHTV